MNSDSEEFVRLLTEAQGPVYGYLLTLIQTAAGLAIYFKKLTLLFGKKLPP